MEKERGLSTNRGLEVEEKAGKQQEISKCLLAGSCNAVGPFVLGALPCTEIFSAWSLATLICRVMPMKQLKPNQRRKEKELEEKGALQFPTPKPRGASLDEIQIKWKNKIKQNRATLFA